LNSYENRVYQIGMEEGPMLVAKFYRPGRWSDAAILEEHAFVEELAAQELPVVAPLMIAGTTLHRFAGHRFAVFAKRGGRAPELEDSATLEWMGRFIGRIHSSGAQQPFQQRPALDIASFGEEPRDFLLGPRLHSRRPAGCLGERHLHGAGRCAPLLRSGWPGAAFAPARRLPCRQRAVE